MSAAQFIGRVGGIAAALGVGVAILSGPAVAGAETDGSNNSSRASASSSRSDSANASRSDSAAPTRRGMNATRAEASAPARGRVTREVTKSVPEAPPVSVTRPVFWATPPRSKVPPLTLMTPVRNRALAWTRVSVPAVTLVPPV